MSDKVYLGQMVGDLGIGERSEPITRVSLVVDSENYITAGNDSGRTIEVSCPWGTQEMANSILSSLSGIRYLPYNGIDALLDPAAELGDGITAGGIYSVLASAETTFDEMIFSDVSAPETDEIDDEYPYESKVSREARRQIAKVYSRITKTSEQIMLEVNKKTTKAQVQSLIDINTEGIMLIVNSKISEAEAQSMIDVGLGSIVLSASAGSNQSTITITAGGIEIDSAVVRFSSIEADSVNASNIYGSLTSDQIDLYGDLTVYTDDTLRWSGGSLGYVSSTLDGTPGIHLESTSGYEVRTTSNGAAIDAGDASVVCNGNSGDTSINGGSYVYVNAASDFVFSSDFYPGAFASAYLGLSSNKWEAVYSNTGDIQTSDETRKTDIVRDITPYLDLFDKLQPASGKYVDGTSGRTHLYLIAQDVERALEACGMTTMDFAALIKAPKTDREGKTVGYDYALRYAEFIPLIVAKLQDVDRRLREMEATA